MTGKDILSNKVSSLEEELTKVQLVLLDFSKRLTETENTLKHYQYYYPLPPSLINTQKVPETPQSNESSKNNNDQPKTDSELPQPYPYPSSVPPPHPMYPYYNNYPYYSTPDLYTNLPPHPSYPYPYPNINSTHNINNK